MIRVATIDDLESIVAIHNQAIAAGFQTAFTDALVVSERVEWFAEHTEFQYPIFVYMHEEQVAGWISISPYRSGRAALRFAVEVSYFVHAAYRNMGVGSQLLHHAVNVCTELEYHTIIAIIIDKNAPSIRLVQRYGFEQWGNLPGVAVFDGVICGHLYFGRTLLQPQETLTN